MMHYINTTENATFFRHTHFYWKTSVDKIW